MRMRATIISVFGSAVGAALCRDSEKPSRRKAAPTVIGNAARIAPRVILFLLATTTCTLRVEAKEITLPEEKAQLAESPLPGYALATALCYTCHSVDYVLYQPSSTSRAWWKTTMTKMQKTFAAPIPDSAMEPLIDYLVKTYGVERNVAAAAAPAKAEAPMP